MNYFWNKKSKVNIQAIKNYWRYERALPSRAQMIVNLVLVKKCEGPKMFEVMNGKSECLGNPLISMDLEEGSYLIYVHGNSIKSTIDKERPFIVNVSCSNYFGLEYKGIDENFGLLKHFARSYALAENKGKKSGNIIYHYIYNICDARGYQIIMLENCGNNSILINGSHANINLREINDETDIKCSIAPNGGTTIMLFTKDELYVSGGLKFPYKVSNLSDSNICEQRLCDVDDICANSIFEDISYEGIYTWVHKQFKMDVSRLYKKIDAAKFVFDFLKHQQPDKMKLICAVPKCSDGVKVRFGDMVSLAGGQFYIGEFQCDNLGIRHGRGYFQFKDTTHYIGQIKNNQFEGMGKMYYAAGQIVEINFTCGMMDGEGVLYSVDGRVTRCLYENNKFIKWL